MVGVTDWRGVGTPGGPTSERSGVVVAPRPLHEARRLVALARAFPQESPQAARPHQALFDAVVREAASALDAPGACLTRVHAATGDVVASVGPVPGTTTRDAGLYSHAVASAVPTVVADLRRDRRFHDHPDVVGGLRLRASATVPVLSADGHAIAALAVLDRRPRHFDAEMVGRLEGLAEQVAVRVEQAALRRCLDAWWSREGPSDHPDAGAGRPSPIEDALRLVADHQGWPLGWVHVAVADGYRIVGARGIDPHDLETGLALYEMRHRLRDLAGEGRARRVCLDDVPSTLAILAEEIGGPELFVVPVAAPGAPPAWLVFGADTRPGLQHVVLAELDRLAADLAAATDRGEGAWRAAPTPESAPGPGGPVGATTTPAAPVAAAEVDRIVASAAVTAAEAIGVEVTLHLDAVRSRVDVARLRVAVDAMVRAAGEGARPGAHLAVTLTTPHRHRLRLVVAPRGRGPVGVGTARARALAAHPASRSRPSVDLEAVQACAAWHGGAARVDVDASGGLQLRLELPRRLLVGVPAPAVSGGTGPVGAGPRSAPGA